MNELDPFVDVILFTVPLGLQMDTLQMTFTGNCVLFFTAAVLILRLSPLAKDRVNLRRLIPPLWRTIINPQWVPWLGTGRSFQSKGQGVLSTSLAIAAPNYSGLLSSVHSELWFSSPSVPSFLFLFSFHTFTASILMWRISFQQLRHINIMTLVQFK